MNVGDLLAFCVFSTLFAAAAFLIIYGACCLIDDWRDR